MKTFRDILDAQNFLKGFGSFVWNGLFIPLLCKPLLIYLDKKTQLSKLCVGKSSQVKSSRHKQANIDMFVCLTCFSSRASFLPFYFFSLSRICVSTKNGILLPKLFGLTLRKSCSSHQEKLCKIEQFIQTVKCQNNFW